ncbi:SCO family protein [Zooshikella harenae]|uniref:SCO family protein n=1 Tax=Zooshikella harenae TaxID=2827238 RepID=A0ABS5ZD35_9GAMM|nr:SCO family protein [Zooshikella harenae]MBU2711241.1 SCO family protein [Zooshikella harenae]
MTPKRIVLTAQCLLALAIIITAYFQFFKTDSAPYSPTSLMLGEHAPDFTLQSGQSSVSLSSFKHKQAVAIYFGYTSCPDVCPTGMSQLANAVKQLTPHGQTQIQGLMITLDPQRDSAEVVNTYAQFFFSDFKGLSGHPTAINTVANQYHVIYQRKPSVGSALQYTLDHSSNFYLIDKQGILRHVMPHTVPTDVLVKALRSLLNDN